MTQYVIIFLRKYVYWIGFIFCIAGCLSLSHKGTAVTVDIEQVLCEPGVEPVIVLGGGVAGLTAALYCAQARIPVVVLEGAKRGGALSQSHSVRNWPGVIDAPGADIVGKIRAQVEALGVQIYQENAVGVDFSQWPLKVDIRGVGDASATRTVSALAVIVATGTEPNLLGIPGEKTNWGAGVSNCAVCEGSLYKGKSVVIVGGGDAAVTEADYLADIVRDVTIFVRKDAFRAKDTKALEKVRARPNVAVSFNTEVHEIIGDGKAVTGVKIFNNRTKIYENKACDGVFLAIGSRPNTAIFKGNLAIDGRGFIMLKHHQATSVPGVFAAGDVCDDEFVQAVTASSDGCKAALQAIKFLKERGFNAEKHCTKVRSISVPLQVDQKKEIHIDEIKTDSDFQEKVVRSPLPVVLDIFTPRCIPCQQLKPIFADVASIFAGRVQFFMMNASNAALDLETLVPVIGGDPIQSVPTIILINQGREVVRMQGMQERTVLSEAIQKTFHL